MATAIAHQRRSHFCFSRCDSPERSKLVRTHVINPISPLEGFTYDCPRHNSGQHYSFFVLLADVNNIDDDVAHLSRHMSLTEDLVRRALPLLSMIRYQTRGLAA